MKILISSALLLTFSLSTLAQSESVGARHKRLQQGTVELMEPRLRDKYKTQQEELEKKNLSLEYKEILSKKIPGCSNPVANELRACSEAFEALNAKPHQVAGVDIEFNGMNTSACSANVYVQLKGKAQIDRVYVTLKTKSRCAYEY